MNQETLVDKLTNRIRQLEDIDAIKRLTATYGLCINKGWNGKEIDVGRLPTLFTKRARWRSAAMQVDVVGGDSIAQMLKKQTADLAFAMHSFTNPIIEVVDDTATGNWLLWVATKANSGLMQVFQSEDLEYTRTTSGWLINSIELHYGDTLSP